MRDLAADRKLCRSHQQWQKGWSGHSPSKTEVFIQALESALDELERLYAMLEYHCNWFSVGKYAVSNFNKEGWTVTKPGSNDFQENPPSFPTLREALHRAWELEATK